MKALIKALILTLVCIFIFFTGCGNEDYIKYKEPGFNNDILKEISLDVEKQTTATELKDELGQFKSFSDELFTIWSEHISKTSSMLDDFNSSTILEEKLICSDVLEQRYSEFKVNLESIEPPEIAKDAYGLAFEAVSHRVLFFKKYNENAPVRELNELEGKAYIAEAGFWDEIERIYKYFDDEMAGLDAEKDNKYIVIK
jgi:hypothetical protein